MNKNNFNRKKTSWYKILDSYKRFDQKKHMYYQGEWNSNYAHLSRDKKYISLHNKIKKNVPGFETLNYAFYKGASANLKASDFDINRANCGGTSWKLNYNSEKQGDFLEKWHKNIEWTTKIIKKAARLYGANDVGVCYLDPNFVYSHYYDIESKSSFPIIIDNDKSDNYDLPLEINEERSYVIPASMQYVIVLIHEMDYTGVAMAPKIPQMAVSSLAYSHIAFTTIAMVDFIRTLGYNAIPSANCTAANIPLAIAAGLGQEGRHGMLIHPTYGPRCRISKVITDLPLVYDTPIDFGAKEFCISCGLCSQKCPSKAIPAGNREYNSKGEFSSTGILKWQLDYSRCRGYWVNVGTNCGLCIANCPFNNPKDSRKSIRNTIDTRELWKIW